ncbi:MAG: putative iron-sulfur-binding oxidoreductase FadF [Syntrophus sp. SKADARSKE-3]|nr:putative iron-sulfur-binding oxidoreductase FadF [Syntrophus sp. SKADARSKE-3]
MDEKRIDRIIRKNALYQCLECGKCSAACPRRVTGKEYSPRLLAHKVIAEREDEAFIENAVWECLTCEMCSERCPSGVDFSGFILEMRSLLAETKGLKGYRAHDGAVHSWMRMMTAPELKQHRLDWVTEDLQIADSGETAYFVGCAPYFDVFFAGIEVDTVSIAKDSIRLLNFMDIRPVLLSDERCCGHDLLWTGDHENFERLCRLNYETFKTAGIREIVVSCPECFYILSEHMPRVVPGFDLKITLLLDLIQKEVHKGGMTFRPLERKATFQDPCRLGRILNRDKEPRDLLKRIPSMELTEMEHHGRGAVCCGNSGFINCDAHSKQIQVERLQEARMTGADLLVTACPKCMIHLTCAIRDRLKQGAPKLEMRDIMSVLADQIEWYGG